LYTHRATRAGGRVPDEQGGFDVTMKQFRDRARSSFRMPPTERKPHTMIRRLRIAQIACIGVFVLTLVFAPAAVAVRPAEPGASAGCTPSAPGTSIANTWAWASPGSWGLPGQQLGYAVNVSNRDLGCGSTTFAVSMSAPSGFSVSMPQSTITLNSAASGYVWANVTSPNPVADGDYPLTVTVERAGAPGSGSSATSFYKVYSSDTVAPRLYWMNPANGGALSGRTANVGFASSDDHALRQLDLFVDNNLVATKLCDNLSYECQVSYKWSIRRVRGQHTATFRSTDWLGNVSSQTSTFTVN
jgi:hypothetical protein